jgi:hypothetical protein
MPRCYCKPSVTLGDKHEPGCIMSLSRMNSFAEAARKEAELRDAKSSKCTCGPNLPVYTGMPGRSLLHQWNCPLNPDSPMAAAEREANRTIMRLEDRAKVAIQELIKLEVDALRAEHEATLDDVRGRLLALERGGGRDTIPAPVASDAYRIKLIVDDIAAACEACGKLSDHGSERGREHTCGSALDSLRSQLMQGLMRPHEQSWSGASVVPRGSSRPPLPASDGVRVSAQLPFNEWPSSVLGPDMGEGGLE